MGEAQRLVNVFPHQISAELIIAIGLALLGGLMVLVLQRLAEQ